MTEPNPMQFRRMGLQRRIQNVWLRKKFKYLAKRAIRKRNREIAKLTKRNHA